MGSFVHGNAGELRRDAGKFSQDQIEQFQGGVDALYALLNAAWDKGDGRISDQQAYDITGKIRTKADNNARGWLKDMPAGTTRSEERNQYTTPGTFVSLRDLLIGKSPTLNKEELGLQTEFLKKLGKVCRDQVREGGLSAEMQKILEDAGESLGQNLFETLGLKPNATPIKADRFWWMDQDPAYWKGIRAEFVDHLKARGLDIKDGIPNGDFNLKLRQIKEDVNARFGADLKPGMLTERLRQDIMEKREWSGATVTAPIRRAERTGMHEYKSSHGLLRESAEALRARAGGFSQADMARLDAAKDGLDTFMNFICPEGKKAQAIFAEIQGKAIDQVEEFAATAPKTIKGVREGQPDYETLKTGQYRTPGLFASLRDQLTSHDPRIANQETQQAFWQQFQERYNEFADKGQAKQFMDKVAPALKSLGLDPTAVQRDLKAGVVGQRVDAGQDSYVRISHFSSDGRQGPTDLSAKTFAVAAAAIIPALSVEPGPKVAPAVLNI